MESIVMQQHNLGIEKEGNVLISEENENVSLSVLHKARIRINLEKIQKKVKIKVEKGGVLDLFIESKGEKNAELEIEVNEHGRLNIKERYEGASRVAMCERIVCKERSSVTRQVANFSAGEIKIILSCSLNGEGADFSDVEIHFGARKGKTENRINIDHNVSNTKSNIRVKGAFKDASKNFTYGTVAVKKDTVNTSTFLSVHALLLDKSAHAVVIPALEIESADVQAGHAASVSAVDENHLFYLESRGLSAEEAKKEVVKAFLLDLVCEQELGTFIESRWEEKIAGA